MLKADADVGMVGPSLRTGENANEMDTKHHL